MRLRFWLTPILLLWLLAPVAEARNSQKKGHAPGHHPKPSHPAPKMKHKKPKKYALH